MTMIKDYYAGIVVINAYKETCAEIQKGTNRPGYPPPWDRRTMVIMGDQPIMPSNTMIITPKDNIHTNTNKTEKTTLWNGLRGAFAVNVTDVKVMCVCDVTPEIADMCGYDSTDEFRNAFTAVTIVPTDLNDPLRVDPEALVTVVDFDRPKPAWAGAANHIIRHSWNNFGVR